MILWRGGDDDDDRTIAHTNLDRARQEAYWIDKLPRELGAQVVWPNGVVWTRRTVNGWWPTNIEETPENVRARRYWPSAHIAESGTWRDATVADILAEEQRMAGLFAERREQ